MFGDLGVYCSQAQAFFGTLVKLGYNEELVSLILKVLICVV